MKTLWSLVTLLSLVLITTSPARAQEGSPEKPNIILIFVDDMGYADATCYNDDAYVKTPAIDELAGGGVRFTDGYVSHPKCFPSRVGLMTGAYQQRFGYYRNIPKGPAGVPEEQLLMPEALQKAGYTTGLVGKWNSVKVDAANIAESGMFDEVHYPMDFMANDFFGVEYNRPPEDGSLTIWGPQEGEPEYLTDRQTDAAVQFIESHAGSPFFLYLAYNAPHSPMQAHEKYRDQVAHLPTEPERVYAAMLLSIDEGVARVTRTLREAGIAENTLVVFTSDNGPAVFQNKWRGYPEEWPEVQMGKTSPLTGNKGGLGEGGIRVPFIIHWPAGLEAGQVENRMVSTLDLYPTFLAMAGAEKAEGTILDGRNLLPYLADEKDGPIHEHLFWAKSRGQEVRQGAMRGGKWKVRLGRDEEVEALYNLEQDIDESDDVSAQNPEVATRLHEAYMQWLHMVGPPAGADDF
jgi:arylsulfatase A-like enzyme